MLCCIRRVSIIELTDEGRARIESSSARPRGAVLLAQTISHSPLAALPSVPGPHLNRPTGGEGEGDGAGGDGGEAGGSGRGEGGGDGSDDFVVQELVALSQVHSPLHQSAPAQPPEGVMGHSAHVLARCPPHNTSAGGGSEGLGGGSEAGGSLRQG